MVLRVGLTGGIGCGKSHVLRRLRAHGIATLDLDPVAHQLMAPGGSAYREVVAAFGPGILSEAGEIDRKALGRRVFADSAARARLNAIVHPRVRAEERRAAVEAAKQGHPLLVTDAALLVEAGLHLRYDRLIVVHCSRERQLERIQARDGLDSTQAAARIDAQMPVAEKRTYGHFQVETEGALADTDQQVDRVMEELQHVAVPLARPQRLAERGAAGLLAARSAGLEMSTTLAQEMAAAGGVDMERLACAIGLAGSEPWYRKQTGPAPAQTLVATVLPVVLWVLARRGVDLDLVASASASMGRLADTAPVAIASACLFGLALAEMAILGDTSPWPDRVDAWQDLALRWGGACPARSATATVADALANRAEASSAAGSVLLAMRRPETGGAGALLRTVERIVAVASAEA